MFGSEADPGVGDQDADTPVIVDARKRHGDATAGPVVLDRVRQQVEQDLLEPVAVGKRVAVVPEAGDVEVDRDIALARDRRHEGHRLVGELGELYRLGRNGQPPALDAGDVQDLVDELEQVPSAAEDVVHVLALPVTQIIELEELTETDDRVQGCPELVAHAGEELALGAVRGFGASARPEQLRALLFGSAFCGDVLGGSEV